MSAYYNENDPKAAAWLRELIKEKLIAFGEVDERSIEDVDPNDLKGFTQCHFFAGIGGWSYALRLAGWPDDRKVWTGSCPCQSLSCAGLRKGHADKRHLWPAFHRLIAKCKPATIFGEQVASPLGFEWLAGVRADLEASGYACGAADLCAAGVGAPHRRQRLFWVALSDGGNSRNGELQRSGQQRQFSSHGRASGFLENVDRRGCGKREGIEERIAPVASTFGLENSTGGRCEQCSSESKSPTGISGRSAVGGMAYARYFTRCAEQGNELPKCYCGVRQSGAWSNFQLVPCRDGKLRRIESGTFPLAHGIPNRVGLLRGYGNAINPQIAAEFIQAAEEALI